MKKMLNAIFNTSDRARHQGNGHTGARAADHVGVEPAREQEITNAEWIAQRIKLCRLRYAIRIIVPYSKL